MPSKRGPDGRRAKNNKSGKRVEKLDRFHRFRKSLTRQFARHHDRAGCVLDRPVVSVLPGDEVRLQFLHYCPTTDKRLPSEAMWKFAERMAKIRPDDFETSFRVEAISWEGHKFTRTVTTTAELAAIKDGTLERDAWEKDRAQTFDYVPEPERSQTGLMATFTPAPGQWGETDQKRFDDAIMRRFRAMDCVDSVDSIEHGERLKIEMTLGCAEFQPGRRDLTLYRATHSIAQLFARYRQRREIEFVAKTPYYVDEAAAQAQLDRDKAKKKADEDERMRLLVESEMLGPNSKAAQQRELRRKQRILEKTDPKARAKAEKREALRAHQLRTALKPVVRRVPLEFVNAIRTRKMGVVDFVQDGEGPLTKKPVTVAGHDDRKTGGKTHK